MISLTKNSTEKIEKCIDSKFRVNFLHLFEVSKHSCVAFTAASLKGNNTGENDNRLKRVENTIFLKIRTSKFWPSLIVFNFLGNLSLNCS